LDAGVTDYDRKMRDWGNGWRAGIVDFLNKKEFENAYDHACAWHNHLSKSPPFFRKAEQVRSSINLMAIALDRIGDIVAAIPLYERCGLVERARKLREKLHRGQLSAEKKKRKQP